MEIRQLNPILSWCKKKRTWTKKVVLAKEWKAEVKFAVIMYEVKSESHAASNNDVGGESMTMHLHATRRKSIITTLRYRGVSYRAANRLTSFTTRQIEPSDLLAYYSHTPGQ